MGTIVRNASSNGTIYRWNGYILRTPIVLHLTPDQKKVYQIGDESSRGADGYLHSGFRGSGTGASVVSQVGYQLVNQMINGSPRWLDASGTHDPEFVWYQGAYSTSQSYVSTGKVTSEAYAQLAGFHFTLPSSARGHVKSVKVNFQNMGCVWAYGPAIDLNSRNKNILNADYGWDEGSWTQAFHFLNTETCNYHQSTINTYPYDDVVMSGYGSAGDFRGKRDLWTLGGGAGSVDGYIPTLTNPVTQSYNLGSSTLASFKSNNGGWIVPSIHPGIISTTNYLPKSGWGGTGTDNYWACTSLRDITMDVTLDIGE